MVGKERKREREEGERKKVAEVVMEFYERLKCEGRRERVPQG